DHVTVSFARSGGAGGQNVNKGVIFSVFGTLVIGISSLTVNTKVDMRFNVMNAHWLPLQVRNKLLQTEKNRINSDGELVISSTRTRTQNAAAEDMKRLQSKKLSALKKSARRDKGSWD
ncbi:hypothetical protein SELMODRAFT_109917, partial [Selaginella moellendorffii]